MVAILQGVRINGAWHGQAFVMQLSAEPTWWRGRWHAGKNFGCTSWSATFRPSPTVMTFGQCRRMWPNQWRENNPRPTSSRPNIWSRLANIYLSRTMFLLLWTCTSWWVRSFHGWRTRWRFGKSGRRRLILTTKDSLLNSFWWTCSTNFICVTFEGCKKRRCSRSYMVPACLKA